MNELAIGFPVWYGWSPVGLSGSFGEQLIALAGSLSERRRWVEQQIVPFLRQAPSNALAFTETEGVGLVYRRTDTGVDNAGRGGAFFTEALVFDAGLPVDHLALMPGLLRRTGPPTQFPGTLGDVEVLRPTQALRAIADDIAPAAVALSHLAAGQQAQPPVDVEADAWRLLCLVVRALPGPLASGAVHESPPRDRHFAINVQAGALAVQPEPAWLRAAELLLNPTGEAAAQNVVSALMRFTSRRTDFCLLLGAWADLELIALTDGELDAKQEAFLLRDPPALLPALAARGGWRTALRYVTSGSTTLEEILRVSPDEARKSRVDLLPTRGPDGERPTVIDQATAPVAAPESAPRDEVRAAPDDAQLRQAPIVRHRDEPVSPSFMVNLCLRPLRKPKLGIQEFSVGESNDSPVHRGPVAVEAGGWRVPMFVYVLGAVVSIVLFGIVIAAIMARSGQEPTTANIIVTGVTPASTPGPNTTVPSNVNAFSDAAALARDRRSALDRVRRAAPANVRGIKAIPANPIEAKGAFVVRVSGEGDAGSYRKRILRIPGVLFVRATGPLGHSRFVYLVKFRNTRGNPSSSGSKASPKKSVEPSSGRPKER